MTLWPRAAAPIPPACLLAFWGLPYCGTPPLRSVISAVCLTRIRMISLMHPSLQQPKPCEIEPPFGAAPSVCHNFSPGYASNALSADTQPRAANISYQSATATEYGRVHCSRAQSAHTGFENLNLNNQAFLLGQICPKCKHKGEIPRYNPKVFRQI